MSELRIVSKVRAGNVCCLYHFGQKKLRLRMICLAVHKSPAVGERGAAFLEDEIKGILHGVTKVDFVGCKARK